QYFSNTEIYDQYFYAYTLFKYNAVGVIIFYIIFIISLAGSLRGGRYGNDYKKQYNKYQLSELLYIGVPTLLIAFFMGKGMPILLKKLGGFLYELRITNNAAAYFRQRERVRTDREAAQKFINDTKEARAEITNPWLLSNKQEKPHKSFFKYLWNALFSKISLEQLLITLGIIVVILALILIIRRFLNASWLKRYNLEYTVRSITPAKKPVKKANKKPVSDNRAKVRKIYKEFLMKLKIKQVVITDSMTSADILDSLHDLFDRKSATALRNVYIVARYNDYANISDEDLNIASEALKHI
ncbi:MAG: hypothetical protein IK050_04840, partial [Lachnospiraceae bacterium]|nr:hypothetical protein [Lachnospiraceae bacterium]